MLFMKMKKRGGGGSSGGENDVKGLLTARLRARRWFSEEKSRARQEAGEDQERVKWKMSTN